MEYIKQCLYTKGVCRSQSLGYHLFRGWNSYWVMEVTVTGRPIGSCCGFILFSFLKNLFARLKNAVMKLPIVLKNNSWLLKV